MTVIELLDNFLGSEQHPDEKPLNNRQIRDLREEIVRFYEAVTLPEPGEYDTQVFLGGFLSSPPFAVEPSPYIDSALLCTDAVVLFDPLHYWFSDEQYARPRLMRGPTGWKDLDPNSENYGRPDYQKTKRYLAHTLPWLNKHRGLIESGGIVLIPADRIVAANLDHTKQVGASIKEVVKPLEGLADQFSPTDITVDDNCKGLFTFAGGSRTIQIRRAITRGIEHFAKDVIISNAVGSVYAAPFPWEQHLGKKSFNEYLATKAHANVVEGICNLRLPILANLSPEILDRLRQDSGFSAFRSGLHEALGHIDAEIGSADFARNVAEIEEELLLPRVEAIHQEVKSVQFQRVTRALSHGFMTYIQVFAGGAVGQAPLESNLLFSGVAGIAATGFSYLLDVARRRALSPDRRIWMQLVPEKPSLPTYGSNLTLREASDGVAGWSIPTRPSRQVTVSSGVIKAPWG